MRHFVLCTVVPLHPVVPVVLILTLTPTPTLIVQLYCPTALLTLDPVVPRLGRGAK